MTLKKQLSSLAKELGADLFGVTSAGIYPEYLKEATSRLESLKVNKEDYMLSEEAETFFRNLSDFRHTLPEAQSIILIGAYAYDKNSDYSSTREKLQGKTARTYVYYPVIRIIAEEIAAVIQDAGFQAVQGQHIPLKYAASQMGLAAYGWNGILLTKQYGSFIAMRAILTDAKLEPDVLQPEIPPCEDCGRCLKACPTGALYEPYKVNPALCINPLSRKEGEIAEKLRNKMGSWVCGCDICQEVCPWNKELKPRSPDPRACFDPDHHSSHRTLSGLDRTPNLEVLLEKRKNNIMQRNAIIALSNSSNVSASDILKEHAQDIEEENQSCYEWAIRKLWEG